MPGIQPQSRDNRDALTTLLIFFALLFAPALYVLLFHPLFEAQRQHHVNQTYVPVDARIVSSTVAIHHGDKSTYYLPEITYAYEVNGTDYQSSQLRAIYVSGDEDWANEIVSHYRPEQTYKAYYNPANPGEAVLIHTYSFSPYFQMLMATFSVSGVVSVWLAAWFRRKRNPVPADTGLFKFLPQSSVEHHLTVAKICTAIWYGLGGVTAAHYLCFVPSPHASQSLQKLMAFGLMGLVPFGFMLYYRRITRYLTGPQLLLNLPAATPGHEFKFTISQQARRELTLTSVNMWLQCMAVKSKGRHSRETSQLLKDHPIALRNHSLRAGEPLELSGALTIPPGLPPTGRESRGWINWSITLQCKLKGGMVYETTFPLTVTPTPVEDAVPPRPADLPSRAQAQVQDVGSQPAARILSKGHIAVAYVVGLSPVFLMLAGMAAMFLSYGTVFHDQKLPSPIVLPATEALPVFIAGVVITLGSSLLGLIYPGTGGAYLRRVAIRTIRQRPGAIVNPEAKDSLFVDVVPRNNWNRMMLENASDVGFLAVDLERREIRFEGDRQRYRIPAESICSCTLEKTVAMQGASPNAMGYWMVVVRAYDANAVWEAPFAIRPTKGRGLRRFPTDATKELHARITSLLPKSAEKLIGGVSSQI